ncbi:MAG: toprim domain-containing protein [Betaproteobacteria bacterium]|nr:toprim domain-containing protein [Betaproteobacteria bacterium]
MSSLRSDTSELAHRLARNAESVCRYYLSNGRREGRYWLVGDVHNTPGRSMYVRLSGPESGRGAAGKWTDASEGTHGDLLDIIREACGLTEFRDVADEAWRFLGLERPDPSPRRNDEHYRPLSDATSPDLDELPDAARRLFRASKPIRGTVAEAYLRRRGVTSAVLQGLDALRFHPCCLYRTNADADGEALPAMIAAVTSLDGTITGVHRTWLDLLGRDKAPVETPRRALGHLLGHAVRFGKASDTLAAGEGIETVLSLRSVLPRMPMAAALSSAHLGALLLPAGLRRLYVIRDADPAGDKAVEQLSARAASAGIELRVLSPRLGDFNDDLAKLGITRLRASVRAQLAPGDAIRFMGPVRRAR